MFFIKELCPHHLNINTVAKQIERSDFLPVLGKYLMKHRSSSSALETSN